MTLLPCPCCGSPAITDPGGFEICRVCGWEDDGQGDEDADRVRGGPNGDQSLTTARRNYAERAAFEARLRAGATKRTDGP